MAAPGKTILLSTVGGQPQVVTFALDLLLARNERIDEVYVLHLSPVDPRVRNSLSKIAAEFPGDTYASRQCRFRTIALHQNSAPMRDLRDGSAAEATWDQVRGLIAEWKGQGHRLHLCISGGRRLMGLLITSAAALLCDHQDNLWHLYTPEEIRRRAEEGAVMHMPPEAGIQLIRVPIVPWGTYFPGLRALAQAPQSVVAAQMEWLTAGHERQCRQVLEHVTERQRATLLAFARGSAPQDVAEALGITLHTVNSHKTAILAECRIAWGLGEEERLDYRFIRERFERYLRQQGEL
jgi:CRISPR-associated protein Csx14